MHTTTHIGLLVIFGVVLLPVYVMFAGWLVGRPREYRTVALTVGYMIGFTVLIVAGLAVTGLVISLITTV
ncbi:hypothetical protein CV102_09565 [Natronococcus pandeyae]|uniref:Uncharacterized protein n=1 Tax=Natronococcus pandeyae TaxID=2055836 RepID=A0A8J8TSG1_9EURY|nr:hypothetical protein [Natronococcus pandeyae]TYL38754.1 hypothetical protein CV102_09565 [Natronococcus pandeyae]